MKNISLESNYAGYNFMAPDTSAVFAGSPVSKKSSNAGSLPADCPQWTGILMVKSYLDSSHEQLVGMHVDTDCTG